MDKDDLTSVVIFGVVFIMIFGLVIGVMYVAKEDKECRSLPDKVSVPKGWETNKSLLDQFDKCCDRGYTYVNNTNTVWCFG